MSIVTTAKTASCSGCLLQHIASKQHMSYCNTSILASPLLTTTSKSELPPPHRHPQPAVPACLPARTPVRLPIHTPMRPPICLRGCAYVRPSVRPSVHPSVRPSVRPSIRPSVHAPVLRVFVRASVRPCLRACGTCFAACYTPTHRTQPPMISHCRCTTGLQSASRTVARHAAAMPTSFRRSVGDILVIISSNDQYVVVATPASFRSSVARNSGWRSGALPVRGGCR